MDMGADKEEGKWQQESIRALIGTRSRLQRLVLTPKGCTGQNAGS